MINNVKFGSCEGFIKPFGAIEKKESKSENNIIKVKNDMRRILKQLLNMKGEVILNEGVNGTSINYLNNDVDIYIWKEFISNKYEISQHSEGHSTRINFTTQSSVINYLKNNFQ